MQSTEETRLARNWLTAETGDERQIQSKYTSSWQIVLQTLSEPTIKFWGKGLFIAIKIYRKKLLLHCMQRGKNNLFKKQKHALKCNHVKVITCLISTVQK